jgi:hypothetical protein
VSARKDDGYERFLREANINERRLLMTLVCFHLADITPAPTTATRRLEEPCFPAASATTGFVHSLLPDRATKPPSGPDDSPRRGWVLDEDIDRWTAIAKAIGVKNCRFYLRNQPLDDGSFAVGAK